MPAKKQHSWLTPFEKRHSLRNKQRSHFIIAKKHIHSSILRTYSGRFDETRVQGVEEESNEVKHDFKKREKRLSQDGFWVITGENTKTTWVLFYS